LGEKGFMKQQSADKLGTLLGFIGGTVFILSGILWPAEFSNIALWLESTGDAESINKYIIQILRFFDLKSLFIVFGGTISVTFVAFPYKKALRAAKRRRAFQRFLQQMLLNPQLRKFMIKPR